MDRANIYSIRLSERAKNEDLSEKKARYIRRQGNDSFLLYPPCSDIFEGESLALLFK